MSLYLKPRLTSGLFLPSHGTAAKPGGYFLTPAPPPPEARRTRAREGLLVRSGPSFSLDICRLSLPSIPSRPRLASGNQARRLPYAGPPRRRWCPPAHEHAAPI